MSLGTGVNDRLRDWESNKRGVGNKKIANSGIKRSSATLRSINQGESEEEEAMRSLCEEPRLRFVPSFVGLILAFLGSMVESLGVKD